MSKSLQNLERRFSSRTSPTQGQWRRWQEDGQEQPWIEHVPVGTIRAVARPVRPPFFLLIVQTGVSQRRGDVTKIRFELQRGPADQGNGSLARVSRRLHFRSRDLASSTCNSSHALASTLPCCTPAQCHEPGTCGGRGPREAPAPSCELSHQVRLQSAPENCSHQAEWDRDSSRMRTAGGKCASQSSP